MLYIAQAMVAHVHAPLACALAVGPINRGIKKEHQVQVLVRDNNID